MIRIYLACAGGMSTSLLMNRMIEEAKNRGVEIEMQAMGELEVGKHIGEFDVLLLGPQVRYALARQKEMLKDKAPVDVIDMRVYGLMDGKKALDIAFKAYEDFYGKKPE